MSLMQLRWVAIDDEPLALTVLQEYAKKFPTLHLVQSFTDAIAGAEFLRQHPVDLLFIDINMPDISGINLVRALVNKPMVIFTTAYKQFALEGFELDAVDYLLKPIAPERFEKAVQKAIEYFRFKSGLREEKPDALFVRSGYELVKVNLADIEYIESLEDYLKIHRTTGKPVMTLMTVKAILEKLPPQDFQRIHRSYVIALRQVRAIANKKVRLQTIELPLSDRYATFINEWKSR